MSQEKKIINAFGWQSLNVVSQAVLQLIFIFFLAKLISKESFGIMAMALVVTGFIDIFAQIGIGPALIQRKDLTKNQINSSFYLSTILGVLFYLVVYFSAPSIANWLDYEPFIKILRIIGISFLISAVSIVPKSLLLKKLKFKQLFISGFFGMLIGNIIVGLSLAYFDFELWAYVVALLVQNGVMTLFYWYFNPLRLDATPTLKHATPLVKYGGGSTLFNFFNYLASKADVIIVANYSNLNTTVESASRWSNTGIYDRSVWLMSQPITIIGKLSDSVMFSGLSMIQDQQAKLKYAFRAAYSVLAIIALPCTAVLVIYSEDIVLFMLNSNYTDAVPVVKILFIALFLRTIIKLCDAVVRALDKVYSGALIKFIYFVLVATAAYFGLDHGLSGVALGLIIAVVIQFVLMLSLSLKILELKVISLVKLSVGPILIMIVAVILTSAFKALTSGLDLYPFVNICIGLLALAFSYAIVIWLVPWTFGFGEGNMLTVLLRKLPANSIVKKFQNRIESKTNR